MMRQPWRLLEIEDHIVNQIMAIASVIQRIWKHIDSDSPWEPNRMEERFGCGGVIVL